MRVIRDFQDTERKIQESMFPIFAYSKEQFLNKHVK